MENNLNQYQIVKQWEQTRKEVPSGDVITLPRLEPLDKPIKHRNTLAIEIDVSRGIILSLTNDDIENTIWLSGRDISVIRSIFDEYDKRTL